MEVDNPNKESSRNPSQSEDQGGAVPTRVQPAEELLSIQLVPGESDQITKIGSQLSLVLVEQLTIFLQQNSDVFAWTASDLIDQLVNSTSGHEFFSLIDASQDCHWIMLNPNDQKRVSFLTSGGTYCYVLMPFGHKNAGATYQRLVDCMF
ncbi:Retrovirus-related Pol polyprotein from transposon.6 [Sesamum angolense]|uniref:Retrovirus-related Pol polyprotein from transposon.6 n=1 Tax=Sesamum angolense TaxID=2727404 RepID=A0AAE2BTM4_9LAMI|nr:Retrovirus-related Pol polyprotein from transposon.6 [Sesamum angolense]